MAYSLGRALCFARVSLLEDHHRLWVVIGRVYVAGSRRSSLHLQNDQGGEQGECMRISNRLTVIEREELPSRLLRRNEEQICLHEVCREEWRCLGPELCSSSACAEAEQEPLRERIPLVTTMKWCGTTENLLN